MYFDAVRLLSKHDYTLACPSCHEPTSENLQMTVTGGPHSQARAAGAGDFLV